MSKSDSVCDYSLGSLCFLQESLCSMRILCRLGQNIIHLGQSGHMLADLCGHVL